jgi:hypothetical protein
MMQNVRYTLSAGLLFVLLVEPAAAQNEASARAPSPTLWRFLGIPQAMSHARTHVFNRRGNTPRLEKKPPLKNLADPANLESDVPAIRAAAEIKQAEDLKPQKIKAIKFLAEIGCGCYDKDEKVTKALLAALEDCTEEVRLATIEAIADAAAGECCAQCSQRSCCNEKITDQLAKMAYELDENGCYVEPSERVRQAAMEALCVCCPNQGLPFEVIEPERPLEGTEPRDLEGVEEGEDAAPTPPPIDSNPVAPPSGDTAASSPARNGPVPQYVSSRRERPPASEPDSARRDRTVRGAVLLLDPSRNLAHVHFVDKSQRVPVGTRLGVYQRHDDGPQRIGEVKVTQTYPGSAHVRPVDGLAFGDLQQGHWVAATSP